MRKIASPFGFLLVAVAAASSWGEPPKTVTDAYTKALEALGDKKAEFLKACELDSNNSNPLDSQKAHYTLVAMLLRLNERDAAVAYMDAAIGWAENGDVLTSLRWELAKKEGDKVALERLYRGYFERASQKQSWDRSLVSPGDSEYAKQFLQEYLRKLEVSKDAGGLYEALKREFFNYPAMLDICRARLANNPEDVKAANHFITAAIAHKQFELLLDDSQLPAPVRKLDGVIDVGRAISLIKLNRKSDPFAALTKLDRTNPKGREGAGIVATFLFYAELIPTDEVSSTRFAEQFARLRFLAAGGDATGTKEEVRWVLKDHPNYLLCFASAAACQKVGEKELAEQALEAGEQQMTRVLEGNLKNETGDANDDRDFIYPRVLQYYVECHHGDRFVEKFAKLRDPDSKEMIRSFWTLYYISKNPKQRVEAMMVFESLKKSCGKQWSFAAAYGNALKDAGDFRAALTQFSFAEGLVFDGAGSMCANARWGQEFNIRQMEVECFNALHDDKGAEAWLKEFGGVGGMFPYEFESQ